MVYLKVKYNLVFAMYQKIYCIHLILGRAPALIDSWDQALLTAPLFVLLEVLFFFGYRREFHQKIMTQVEANIQAFKARSKKIN